MGAIGEPIREYTIEPKMLPIPQPMPALEPNAPATTEPVKVGA